MRTAAAAGIFAALQAGPALVPAYEPTGLFGRALGVGHARF
jgi:hypothetical protein